MGGTDIAENLVEVDISKHAELHKQLWEDLGQWQDYVAWQGLIGNAKNPDVIRLKQSIAGRIGGLKTKGIKKTIEHRENISLSLKGKPSNSKGKVRTLETKSRMSKPKTEQHATNISLGLKGIKRTPEQKEKYRLAALRRWKNSPSQKQKEKVE